MLVLGSIFHEILSECFINDDYDVILNYEKLISEYLHMHLIESGEFYFPERI